MFLQWQRTEKSIRLEEIAVKWGALTVICWKMPNWRETHKIINRTRYTVFRGCIDKMIVKFGGVKGFIRANSIPAQDYRGQEEPQDSYCPKNYLLYGRMFKNFLILRTKRQRCNLGVTNTVIRLMVIRKLNNSVPLQEKVSKTPRV